MKILWHLTQGILCLLGFITLASLIACSAAKHNGSTSMINDPSERDAVKNVVAHERKAWAARNAEEATLNYADDIYWINAFGIEKHGKAEAKAFITRIFGQAGFNAAKSTKEDIIADVRLLSENLAWAHTYGESAGQLTNSGQAMANRKTHIFYILKKQNNQWSIISFQVMDEKERIQ